MQDAKSSILSGTNRMIIQVLGDKIKSFPLFSAILRVCSRPLLASLGSFIANMNSKFAKKTCVKNKKIPAFFPR